MVSRRVYPAHGPGGLERHVHDLVVHLARAGVEIDLYAETPDDPARAVAAAGGFPEGVTVHWIPDHWLPIGVRRGTIVVDRLTNYPAWSLRVGRWIVREARRRRGLADVVHVHGLAGWGLARAVRRGSLAVPLVLTTHGFEEYLTPSWLKYAAYAPFRHWIGQIADAADRIVATDRILEDPLRRYLRVGADRMVTIPNAVDPDRCRRTADRRAALSWLERTGIQGSRPLLVSVGRVAPDKGFDVLASALGRVAERHGRNWAWVLVGDGPEMARVEAAVGAAGVMDRCRLAGALPGSITHGLLSLADWFVHPTLYEGSSLVTLEAMSHGVAVVASDAGGIPDKVEDGVSGLLAPAGDVDALVETLCRAFSADSRVMGQAGREIVESTFSWTAVLPKVLGMYADLVGRPPRS